MRRNSIASSCSHPSCLQFHRRADGFCAAHAKRNSQSLSVQENPKLKTNTFIYPTKNEIGSGSDVSTIIAADKLSENDEICGNEPNVSFKKRQTEFAAHFMWDKSQKKWVRGSDEGEKVAEALRLGAKLVEIHGESNQAQQAQSQEPALNGQDKHREDFTNTRRDAVTPNSPVGLVALSSSEWVPDRTRKCCSNCGRTFNLITRRHHCRLCGEVVCGECSSNRTTVSFVDNENELSAYQEQGHGFWGFLKTAVGRLGVRVCNRCFLALTDTRKREELGSLYSVMGELLMRQHEHRIQRRAQSSISQESGEYVLKDSETDSQACSTDTSKTRPINKSRQVPGSGKLWGSGIEELEPDLDIDQDTQSEIEVCFFVVAFPPSFYSVDDLFMCLKEKRRKMPLNCEKKDESETCLFV